MLHILHILTVCIYYIVQSAMGGAYQNCYVRHNQFSVRSTYDLLLTCLLACKQVGRGRINHQVHPSFPPDGFTPPSGAPTQVPRSNDVQEVPPPFSPF